MQTIETPLMLVDRTRFHEPTGLPLVNRTVYARLLEPSAIIGTLPTMVGELLAISGPRLCERFPIGRWGDEHRSLAAVRDSTRGSWNCLGSLRGSMSPGTMSNRGSPHRHRHFRQRQADLGAYAAAGRSNFDRGNGAAVSRRARRPNGHAAAHCSAPARCNFCSVPWRVR